MVLNAAGGRALLTSGPTPAHGARTLCRVNWKGSKKKKQKKKEGLDLYALLGLANERWTANENQLKNGAPELWRPPSRRCHTANRPLGSSTARSTSR